jgi:hypothetical protein
MWWNRDSNRRYDCRPWEFIYHDLMDVKLQSLQILSMSSVLSWFLHNNSHGVAYGAWSYTMRIFHDEIGT